MAVAGEIIQYEYECLGGPLDGQCRSFATERPSGAPRWFVSMRLSLASGEIYLTESVSKPASSVWITLGYYELRGDENRRRGRRIRWRWFSGAAWPKGVSTDAPKDLMRKPFEPPGAKPFEPPAPPTDFSTDADDD